MQLDTGLLRAIEDAVDALVRLDEQVARVGSGLAVLLRLRSAQAIVAANDRPPESERYPGAADDDRHLRAIPDGDAAFAALLGWWYAPQSREFIEDDPHLRRVAVALDAAADKIRNGCELTAGAIEDACVSASLDVAPLSDLLEASLSVAVHESWPALLVTADLSSGACGRERGISASLARAVAPLAGGLTADVFTLPSVGENDVGALHALAAEARTVRRRVDLYGHACQQAVNACDTLGRGGPSAAALVHLLADRPALTVAEASEALDLSAPTAGAAVERLLGLGLLREITGRGRDRVFVYTPAVAIAG